jgi:uncharacterized OsmC-like protein
MRVPVEKIALDSCADVANEDPHIFRSIELNYRFDSSKDLQSHIPQIIKAIHLSKEKLCCVSIMYNQFCTIHSHAYVNGVEVEL